MQSPPAVAAGHKISIRNTGGTHRKRSIPKKPLCIPLYDKSAQQVHPKTPNERGYAIVAAVAIHNQN